MMEGWYLPCFELAFVRLVSYFFDPSYIFHKVAYIDWCCKFDFLIS